MENHIKNLKIQNFKSLRDIEMECSRINLIVGKPNVGKSNILEALSLFCVQYTNDNKHFYSEFIRYDEIGELFFDQDIGEDIFIQSNIGSLRVRTAFSQDSFRFIMSNNDLVFEGDNEHFPHISPGGSEWKVAFNVFLDGKLGSSFDSPKLSIKKYIYKEGSEVGKINGIFLDPPHGSNLFNIILNRKELREEIADWFSEYNLDLVLDKRTKTISAQKREGNIVYPISYKLLADTLKRMIFHHAAIKSNKDSILLFEEPENHSFPPYVYQLAQNIIHDENNNQYFITTHSPHLFNTIVENTPVEEQSIFIANYKYYQTEIKKLSKEELSELLNDGIDIFFNQKYFLDE